MRESEWERRCLLAQARIDQMQALLKDGLKLMDECKHMIFDLVHAVSIHQEANKNRPSASDRQLWEVLDAAKAAGWIKD